MAEGLADKTIVVQCNIVAARWLTAWLTKTVFWKSGLGCGRLQIRAAIDNNFNHLVASRLIMLQYFVAEAKTNPQ